MSVTPTNSNVDSSFITFAPSLGYAGAVTINTTSNTKV
jgi:hypothetical protein